MDIEQVYALGLDRALIEGEELTEDDKMLLAMDASSSESSWLSRLVSLVLAVF